MKGTLFLTAIVDSLLDRAVALSRTITVTFAKPTKPVMIGFVKVQPRLSTIDAPVNQCAK